MSIEWVSSQIAEILHSEASSHEALEKKVVTSLCGDSFVSRSSFIGRLWTFVWGLTRIIDWWGKLEKRAFSAALQKTAHLWQESLTLIAKSALICERMMTAAMQGNPYLIAEERERALKVMNLARLYIYPLFQNYGAGNPEEKWARVGVLLEAKQLLPYARLQLGFLSEFKELFPAMPDALTLSRLLTRLPLDAHQQAAFEAFVHQIKEKETSFSMRDFILALKTILQKMGQEKQLPLFLWEISRALKKVDCQIFTKLDPSHAQEVQKYKDAHKEAFYQDSLIIIPDGKDFHILSPLNQAALYLLKAEGTYGPWQRYLLPLEIEDSGFKARAAPFEKLSHVSAMAPLLRSLVQHALWPPALTPERMVISEGVCKALQPLPLISDPFAYDTALSFMKDHAVDTSDLVKAYREAGLARHPFAKFYRAISYKETTPQQKIALLERFGIDISLSEECLRRAETVRLVLEEVMDAIFSSLKTDHLPKVKVEHLRQLISRALLTGEGLLPALDKRLLVSSSFTEELIKVASSLLLKLTTLNLPSDEQLCRLDEKEGEGTLSLQEIICILSQPMRAPPAARTVMHFDPRFHTSVTIYKAFGLI